MDFYKWCGFVIADMEETPDTLPHAWTSIPRNISTVNAVLASYSACVCLSPGGSQQFNYSPPCPRSVAEPTSVHSVNLPEQAESLIDALLIGDLWLCAQRSAEVNISAGS